MIVAKNLSSFSGFRWHESRKLVDFFGFTLIALGYF